MTESELAEIEAVFEQEDEPDQDWYIDTIEMLVSEVRRLLAVEEEFAAFRSKSL